MLKKTTPVVHRVPLTKARTNLGQTARRAHHNSEFCPLMSALRREMILNCLKHRLHLFQKAVGVDS